VAHPPRPYEELLRGYGPHLNYAPPGGYLEQRENPPDRLVKTHCCFCGFRAEHALIERKIFPGSKPTTWLPRTLSWMPHCWIECPCHEGYFSVETGRVLQGPPQRPLPKVVLRQQGDQLLAVAMDLQAGEGDRHA
jgi:hypothetical protein